QRRMAWLMGLTGRLHFGRFYPQACLHSAAFSTLPPAMSAIYRHRYLLLPVRARRLHEPGKKRVAVTRRRAKLGVELTRDEERMVRQLDHFHEAVAREGRESQTRVHQLLQIAIVELVPVSMAFVNDAHAVDLMHP